MQQEFDAIVLHLYAQGKPAMEHGICAYRGVDGTKCAVGARIPDSVYSPDMEGKNMSCLMECFGDALPPEFTAYEPMYAAVQNVHDYWDHQGHRSNGVTWNDWLDVRLEQAAKELNLTFTKPQ